MEKINWWALKSRRRFLFVAPSPQLLNRYRLTRVCKLLQKSAAGCMVVLSLAVRTKECLCVSPDFTIEGFFTLPSCDLHMENLKDERSEFTG